MASLKPLHWSCAAGRDKTCCSLPKHQGFKYFQNPSRPFIGRISPMGTSSKASSHGNNLASSSQLHRIRPLPKDEQESMKEEEAEDEEEDDIDPQKLDQWIKDSAVEIVNNLGEAPFLVHIYCNGNGNGIKKDGSTPNTKIKMVKEKAIADNWHMIEERWRTGRGTPNGVILVEQLKIKPKTSDEMGKFLGLNNECSCSSTKLWGILIQGKGKSCTACYLLKTSQVQCVAGLCTHFCLWRVDCFVEHVDIQLKKLWLQMG